MAHQPPRHTLAASPHCPHCGCHSCTPCHACQPEDLPAEPLLRWCTSPTLCPATRPLEQAARQRDPRRSYAAMTGRGPNNAPAQVLLDMGMFTFTSSESPCTQGKHEESHNTQDLVQ
eukprot:6491617-Amphidinium_carterae.1